MTLREELKNRNLLDSSRGFMVHDGNMDMTVCGRYLNTSNWSDILDKDVIVNGNYEFTVIDKIEENVNKVIDAKNHTDALDSLNEALACIGKAQNICSGPVDEGCIGPIMYWLEKAVDAIEIATANIN